MPVHKVHRDDRVGFQWGSHGATYFGPGAKGKAALQGRAAYAHGYRGSKLKTLAPPLDWRDSSVEWPKNGDQIVIAAGAEHLLSNDSFILPQVSGRVMDDSQAPDFIAIEVDDLSVVPKATLEWNETEQSPPGWLEISVPFSWAKLRGSRDLPSRVKQVGTGLVIACVLTTMLWQLSQESSGPASPGGPFRGEDWATLLLRRR